MKNIKDSDVISLPSKAELLEIIRGHKEPPRTDALLKLSGAPKSARKNFEKALYELKDEGSIERIPGGRWAMPGALNFKTGKFRSRVSGGGFIVPDDGSGEIQISPYRTKGAWNEDKVKVMLLPEGEGKIVQVLERRHNEIVARVDKCEGNILLCHPTDRKLNVKFKVSLDDPAVCKKRVRPGALILIKPEKELERDLWCARPLNVFGAENSIGVQESIVKCNHHAPGQFPELALRQAKAISEKPMETDGREDMRHIPFVTIDGADSRDFDDAIQVEKTPDGWILRVAIADVSHYVKPDAEEGSLDSEALKRGNSWYFPSSVEPMLPEALSNGLCSLRPDEDRMAMLAEITFDENAKPVKSRFAPIVMRSKGRLTYDAVANFFETGGEKPLPLVPGESAITEDIGKMLKDARELYQGIFKRRRQAGTLDFDLPEPKYKFDSNGKLIGMTNAERNDAHRLIEEFMIAANEAVADFIGSKKIPFLYRVHPEPDSQKLEALYETLDLTGVETIPPKDRKTTDIKPKLIQDILTKAKGTPQDYTVNKLCLRSMQQARYQPVNQGHFGLASEEYCHFTSPIRRYADLLVHRSLKAALGKTDEKPLDEERLTQIGDSLNKLEREAMDCEREIARRMGCLALSEKAGETMSGTISGVTDFGVFVEFDDLPAEGVIRLSDLGADWYDYDQKRQRLVGQHEGKVWSLGQPLKVQVDSVDLDRLEVRLRPEGVVPAQPGSKSRTGKKPGRKSFQKAIKGLPASSAGQKAANASKETADYQPLSRKGPKSGKFRKS